MTRPMTRPAVTFQNLTPWTPKLRSYVGAVLCDLAPLDEREIMGLHPELAHPSELLGYIGKIMVAGLYIEGFIAFEGEKPAAVALAYRHQMPQVASLAFFGRGGMPRAMAACYRRLHRRKHAFRNAYGLRLAQVPVLTDYAAPMKRLKRMGGEAAFDYGPLGPDQLNYTHMIWRF